MNEKKYSLKLNKKQLDLIYATLSLSSDRLDPSMDLYGRLSDIIKIIDKAYLKNIKKQIKK